MKKRKQLSPLRDESIKVHCEKTRCNNCRHCAQRLNEVTNKEMMWCRQHNMRVINPENARYCREFDDKRLNSTGKEHK